MSSQPQTKIVTCLHVWIIFFLKLCIFFKKNIPLQRGCSSSRPISRLWLTYHFHAIGKDLEKIVHTLSNIIFQYTRMYLIKSVGLVMTFSPFSRHINVPYFKLETILNRHSRSHYIHTLRSFNFVMWLRLRRDIFGREG